MAKNKNVHARMAQIKKCLHGGHNDESDPWVLQLKNDRTKKNLSHNLVEPAHPIANHPNDSRSIQKANLRSISTPCKRQKSSAHCTSSAACSTPAAEPTTSATTSIKHYQES